MQTNWPCKTSVSKVRVLVRAADLQGSETQNHTHRDLCVTVELYVPEKWYWKERTEPVRGYVDGCRCVVDVRKRLRGVAFPSFDGSVPSVRHRPAVEDDVQHGNKVHRCEHCRHCIQTVRVHRFVRSNAQQHEGDAELDRNDGCTVEYLEQEEVLLLSVIARCCAARLRKAYLHACLLLLRVKPCLVNTNAVVSTTNACC
jgi:hypothetical protein